VTGGPMRAGALVGKGHTVHGVWHWDHFQDTGAMLTTLRRSEALLEKVITHRFPMNKVTEAWGLQMAGTCGKIILHPWAD